MTQGEVAEMIASTTLDPTEEDRSDVRWALEMSAMHKATTAAYWLSLLPWSPNFITPEHRRAAESRNEQAMLAFARAHRAARPD